MLTFSNTLPVEAHNGGLFVSRGRGMHPDRTLGVYELIVVRSGTLAIQEEATAFSVAAGDTLVLFPNRRHFGTRRYDEDLSFYWFHFDRADSAPSLADAASLQVPQFVKSTGADAGDETMATCRRFLDIQAHGESGYGYRLSLLLLEMLGEIATRASRPARSLPDNPGARLADRADALLRVRFAEPGISTQTVADALGVNPDYLGRVFRRTFGRPLTDALNDYRLKYARSLLLDDGRNIAEIAFASGFTDAGYFRRLFKRNMEVSPNAFRRLHARAYVNTE